MSLAEVCRRIDDALIDRVFQPVVDRAAEWGVKKRHLTCGCYLAAGSATYLEDPHFPLLPIVCFATALGTLRDDSISDLSEWFFARCFTVVAAIVCSLCPPSWFAAAFWSSIVCGAYFSSCHDKPPKRRRWRELKAKLAELTAVYEPIPVRT